MYESGIYHIPFLHNQQSFPHIQFVQYKKVQPSKFSQMYDVFIRSGETTSRVSPYTSFVLQPLPACFITEQRTAKASLFVKQKMRLDETYRLKKFQELMSRALQVSFNRRKIDKVRNHRQKHESEPKIPKQRGVFIS